MVTKTSPSPSTFAPTNLVFQGGGIKGIAYVGVAQALQDQGVLDKVQRVAGTSAGSIFATLFAVGYSPEAMKKLVMATDFSKFEDGGAVRGIFRGLNTYGIYKGDVFLAWMKKIIRGSPTIQGLKANSTFADFHKRGCLDLHVFATDLNTQDIREFSYATTPNVIVAEAVRASMSIPLAFQAWKFSNNVPNNHLYVDGGVLLNYPIDTFDKRGKVNSETLGFSFYDPGHLGKHDSDLDYGHVEEYGKVLFETLRRAQHVELEKNPVNLQRTCFVDDLGVPTTKFALSADEKKRLISSGKASAAVYLQAQQKSSHATVSKPPSSRKVAKGVNQKTKAAVAA